MNVPGLLIEYLITGSIACLWLFPLLQSQVQVQSALKSFSISDITLLAIPFFYVIGLGIDALSSSILHKSKWQKKIREQVKIDVKNKYGVLPDENLGEYRIWLRSAELGKGFDIRSSRDRIARGVSLNFAIAALILPVLNSPIVSVRSLVTFIVYFSLSIAFGRVWVRCERRSYMYKLEAILAISEPDDGVHNSKLHESSTSTEA